MGDLQNYLSELRNELANIGTIYQGNSPKISVIITTYNDEKFLYKCLKSIIFQTFQDTEIIITDRGSIDSTKSILSTFEQFDKRIKIINAYNTNKKKAVLTGLNQARGEYNIVINIKDCLEQHYLEKKYSQIKNNPKNKNKTFYKKYNQFFKEYNETHYILKILGIKIKFPKPYFAKKKKQSLYYKYKKENIDITNLPPATGQLRKIQLANLKLMIEFDRICAENNLQYWLSAGTILGAVRHKGFIPWDDDIDITLLRNDYDKIIKIFNKNLPPDFIAEIYYNPHIVAFTIKIRHKKCNCICLDIYSSDITGKILTKKEQLNTTKQIIKDRKKFEQDNNMSKTERLKNFLDMREKYINSNLNNSHSDILLGLEWKHFEKNWFLKYDSVFPLTKIEFEGHKFMSMAKPEDYLKDYYGNYMKYPKKITIGHSMFLELTKNEKEIIENLSF